MYVAGRFLLLLNFVYLKSSHEEHLSQQTYKFSSSAEYNTTLWAFCVWFITIKSKSTEKFFYIFWTFNCLFCLLCYLLLLFSSFSFFSLSFSALFSSRIRFLSTFSRSSSFFLCTSSFKPDSTSSSVRQTDFWLMPAFLF